MRRKTFYLIGTVSFLCWILIICYLFVHKPLGKSLKYKDVNEQVNRLEMELREQIRSNEHLLRTLKRLKKKVMETGKNWRSLLKEDPSAFNPNSKLNLVHQSGYKNDDTIAILLFACNRITVRRNLDQMIRYRPDARSFPIIVSQDCGHEPTTRVIKSYGDQVTLIQQPNKSDFQLKGKEKKFKGYYKIARHYGWALNQTFNRFNYNTVIIVEDDLDIAPDFYAYFRALYPILKSDPSLWCVSAWNDNGKSGLVSNDPTLLYRTDFFPGLGWMLTKDVWLEIESRWPKAFWDDWIRQPSQRKERACIRPEVSRTKTFGKIGVSNGLFYEKHLKFIKLNDKFVPFTQLNLTYLLRDNYDPNFLLTVYSTPQVKMSDLTSGNVPLVGSVRITYRTRLEFKKAAKVLGLMDDFKSGVPRTGYRGVVSLLYKKWRVYLAPPPDWKGYDVSWT